MIRRAEPSDAAAIAAIYNEYIAHSVITFDTEPVSIGAMQTQISELSAHYPYFVYELDGQVVGYCYAHPWKRHAAYGHTYETTIYLAPGYDGRGFGRMLMEALIEACRQTGCHALIACITADNTASFALHERLGFRAVSHFEQVGYKFGRWLDTVDYELVL